jgi:hypothetical protein
MKGVYRRHNFGGFGPTWPWICEKSAISWMDIVKGIGVKSGTGHRHSIWEDNNIGNG